MSKVCALNTQQGGNVRITSLIIIIIIIKLYMWHGSLAGKLILVNKVLLCLISSMKFGPVGITHALT